MRGFLFFVFFVFFCGGLLKVNVHFTSLFERPHKHKHTQDSNLVLLGFVINIASEKPVGHQNVLFAGY